MPHVVIEGAPDPEEIWRAFEPIRERRGEEILKIDRAYLERDAAKVLLEALVVSAGFRQKFFLQVTRKQDRAVTVRLEPLTDPEKTDAVRRAVAVAARWVGSIAPGSRLTATNLGDDLEELLRSDTEGSPTPESPL